MSTLLQIRRGIASEWVQKNPRLAQGEPGYELDTGQFKIGDGLHHWNDLPYYISGETPDGPFIEVQLQQHVEAELPHPIYDDGTSFVLRYENAKV